MDCMESSRGKKRKRSSYHEKSSKDHDIVDGFESSAGPHVSPVDVRESNAAPAAASNLDTESSKQGVCWPDCLSEAQLDLLVSIKQLAMERFTSIEEDCLEEILPASALQTIGILMDELVKDRVRKMACVHTSHQGRVSSPAEGESMIP